MWVFDNGGGLIFSCLLLNLLSFYSVLFFLLHGVSVLVLDVIVIFNSRKSMSGKVKDLFHPGFYPGKIKSDGGLKVRDELRANEKKSKRNRKNPDSPTRFCRVFVRYTHSPQQILPLLPSHGAGNLQGSSCVFLLPGDTC